MTTLDSYKAFKQADIRWSNDLVLAFGKQAGDKRYTKAGETHPYCVSSYQAFVRTREQWYQSMGQCAALNISR